MRLIRGNTIREEPRLNRKLGGKFSVNNLIFLLFEAMTRLKT
jgi:hypothetical protein